MSKKLNALLGRSSKTAKLKMLANLAISRIAILKNLHSVRCSQAQSDVIQLLKLGHQERALLRVEHVIKEQNTLDAFVLMENYCHLLGERTEMVKNSRECPDELKEAISSLIFAASRCGEFPELQEIRGLFTSKFGKEFATSAVELRNNCGVYPKMIQRLSTRQASLESREKLLKQIAKENGITLQLDHEAFDISSKEKWEVEQLQMQVSNESATFEAHKVKVIPLEKHFPEAAISSETLSESVRARKAYRDVAAAAQDAFESAAYAAAAARAAVELSRLESWDDDPDDHSGSHHQHTQYGRSPISETQTGRDEASEEVNYSTLGFNLVTIHPVDSASSGSDGEEVTENRHRCHFKKDAKAGSEEKSVDQNKLGAEVNESDDEIRKKNNRIARLRYYQNRSDLHRDGIPNIRHNRGAT
ncbi:hypothetical protein Pfo_019192 [Paulownia fortunei]|nr:hypothetical protein Pfo_019192 [Paulownia fortunei]